MPNDSIDAALAEVYALAPNDSIALETLELSNSSLAEPLRIVRDRREWEFTIEGGEVATFLPVPYRINLP